MGFWESQLGEVTGSSEDAFAKVHDNDKTIPNNSYALAKVNAFLNHDINGQRYLQIEWLLTDGDFKGRTVNHKLWVYAPQGADDATLKKRHRALNMLKLMYQLYNLKPKHAGEPTDEDLQVFVGKIAGIRIQETEPNDKGRQYNWVSEIHETQGFKCVTGEPLVVTKTFGEPAPSQNDLFDTAFSRNKSVPNMSLDDDLPF